MAAASLFFFGFSHNPRLVCVLFNVSKRGVTCRYCTGSQNKNDVLPFDGRDTECSTGRTLTTTFDDDPRERFLLGHLCFIFIFFPVLGPDSGGSLSLVCGRSLDFQSNLLGVENDEAFSDKSCQGIMVFFLSSFWFAPRRHTGASFFCCMMFVSRKKPYVLRLLLLPER